MDFFITDCGHSPLSGLGLQSGEPLFGSLTHLTAGFAVNVNPALRDFLPSLVHGESMAILGPNGAGKSSFLKLLTGAFPPEAASRRRDAVCSATIGARVEDLSF